MGAAVARALAREGARIVVADLDGTAARAVANEVAGPGGAALGLAVDCSRIDELEHLYDTAVRDFGQVDIVVNCAGLAWVGFLTDTSESEWSKLMDVNAKGSFFSMKIAARHMIARAKGGRIINLSSVASRGSRISASALYAASKGAVNAMTMVAAQQLGPYDINVNAICPGSTATDMLTAIRRQRAEERGVPMEEIIADAVADIPLGRENTVEDVAALAVFLSSPEARNISAQILHVDGGAVPG